MANPYPSLIGVRNGALIVTSAAGVFRTHRRWSVRCDCGRTEVLLTYQFRRRRACAVCRTPSCVICGQRLARPQKARTCSPECRRRLRAAWMAEKYAADPEFRRARRAQRRRRWEAATPAERIAHAASQLARHRRNRADPDYVAEERRKETAATQRRRRSDELAAMTVDATRIVEATE